MRPLVQYWFLIKIKIFTFDLMLLNLVAFSIILLIFMELVDHNGGIKHFQIFIFVAGVKAYQFRVGTALAEDPRSIPRAHIRCSTTSYNQVTSSLSSLCGHLFPHICRSLKYKFLTNI